MNLKHKPACEIYLKVFIFSLFQKNLSPAKNIKSDVESKDETADFSRIRCPLCCWQPKPSSLWYCADAGFPENFFGSCGTAWNTFDTKGRCPGCAHQWRWTACLACHKSSLHEDWYVEKNDV